MDASLRAFLELHIETFNAAVETGRFEPLVALFSPSAELEFAGVPVGPFVGREAIAAAYAEQPPTDTMRVLDRRLEPDGTVSETFGWTSAGGHRSGELHLTVAGNLIERLLVRFD